MIPFVDIHTHSFIQRENVLAVINYDGKLLSENKLHNPSSVGVHPWYVDDDFDSLLKKLSHYISMSEVVAIGEVGLDRKCAVSISVQEKAFVAQIELSESIGKPLIIHAVASADKLLQLHKLLQPRQPWIIHGFRGKIQLAEQLLNAGFFLSFGKGIDSLALVVRNIPIKQLFLETDDADFKIETVYEKVAHYRSIDIDSLLSDIYKNYLSVFHV